MTRGPLRRLAGAAGLVALAPTGYLFAAGSVGPPDAALRAAGTLVGVVLLGRLADRGLAGILATYERTASADDAGSEDPEASEDTLARVGRETHAGSGDVA